MCEIVSSHYGRRMDRFFVIDALILIIVLRYNEAEI